MFNQILLIYTQDIKLEIKKKCEQVEGLSYQLYKINNNNGRNNIKEELHTVYLSGEFYEDKGLFCNMKEGKEK